MQDQLGTQSMLVAVELGLPRQSTQLKEESTSIEQKNNAAKGVVRPPSAQYFRKADPSNPKKELDGLQKLKEFQYQYKQAIRAIARYPFSGDFYLAPAAQVEALLAVKEKYEPLRMSVWMDWADHDYPDLAESAPTRMGSLFNLADFPSLADCMKRFKCNVVIIPLAEKDQVARITLISQKSQQLLMAHADETQKAAIAELHKQIWKDLMAPLQHVVTVFEKDKPKIYDALLGNLMEIVDTIPNYKELTGDQDLVDAASKIKTAFSNITTEHLRNSDEARKVALTSARQLVAAIQPFARRFT